MAITVLSYVSPQRPHSEVLATQSDPGLPEEGRCLVVAISRASPGEVVSRAEPGLR